MWLIRLLKSTRGWNWPQNLRNLTRDLAFLCCGISECIFNWTCPARRTPRLGCEHNMDASTTCPKEGCFILFCPTEHLVSQDHDILYLEDGTLKMKTSSREQLFELYGLTPPPNPNHPKKKKIVKTCGEDFGSEVDVTSLWACSNPCLWVPGFMCKQKCWLWKIQTF